MKKSELETKKQFAKIGIASTLGIVFAASVLTKKELDNNTLKNLQYGAGAAFIGFSLWHLLLNKQVAEKEKLLKKKTIQLNSFYTEISLTGKLTEQELKLFERKIEGLLGEYNVSSINILVDIRKLDGIEFKAVWNEFLFAIKHYKQFKKIAIVGNKNFEKISSILLNKIISTDIKYYEQYEKANKWLLNNNLD